MLFFFFNDTATTEIYTLSLHDALPISPRSGERFARRVVTGCAVLVVAACFGFSFGNVLALGRYLAVPEWVAWLVDRKSTRLNSSHANISYAVFCLKKKT